MFIPFISFTKELWNFMEAFQTVVHIYWLGFLMWVFKVIDLPLDIG